MESNRLQHAYQKSANDFLKRQTLLTQTSGSNPPEIEWPDYPRIAPGVYRAYSAVAKAYFDKGYRRWVCFIRWNVLSSGLTDVIARVPLWSALGPCDKPRATRRGKYFAEWVRANGGPPTRGDRLSPNVFRHRMAIVEIADTDRTKSPAPYFSAGELMGIGSKWKQTGKMASAKLLKTWWS